MARYKATVDTPRSPAEALAYLSDFSKQRVDKAATMLSKARSLRGALAGATAAAAWAAQQPLDKRVFGFPFDDVELLGKAVTRGPRWQAIGIAMHIANGAVFGAVYANLAPSAQRLPPWGCGPVAVLGEHLATWPATALTDRFHPARAELPQLWRSGRACAQATWRHLLFGVVLGELERRLASGRPQSERTDAWHIKPGAFFGDEAF